MTETKENTVTNFEIFKTIEIGNYNSVETLISNTKAKGNCISHRAEDVMSQEEFTIASKQEEIDLVFLPVAYFGFNNGAVYSDIIEKAQEIGFDLCPAEVALQLCYSDQPKGGQLIIAHKPITGSNSASLMFVYRNFDGNVWLTATRGNLDCIWKPDDWFVFTHCK